MIPSLLRTTNSAGNADQYGAEDICEALIVHSAFCPRGLTNEVSPAALEVHC